MLTLFVRGPLPDRDAELAPAQLDTLLEFVYGEPPGRYRRASSRLEPAEPLARAGLLALRDRIWRAT